MEHEVNVPFSVGSVRAALAEPERVARCVPGLQLDGDGGGSSAKSTGSKAGSAGTSAKTTTEGRLRVRLGGSTITYKGTLTVTRGAEEFTVEGRGTEARGTGSVRLKLTVVPRRSKEGEGTRLVCTGTLKGDGRIKDVEQKTATSAGQRLLERFGKALGESIEQDPPRALDAPGAPAAEATTAEATTAEGTTAEATTEETPTAGTPAAEAPAPGNAGPARGIGEPGDNDRVIPGIPAPDKSAETPAPDKTPSADERDRKDEQGRDEKNERKKGQEDTGTPEGGGQESAETGESADTPDSASRETPDRNGVFETEVPPSSLDPLHDDEPLDEADVEAAAEAEAAHARRTMIGRSAEEVDHAPPRGRYAPVPLPEPIANSAALRWVGPAAAAVVAGAVFIGRALRRRR